MQSGAAGQVQLPDLGEVLAHQQVAGLALGRVVFRVEARVAVCAALGELRDHHAKSLELLVNDRLDVDHHVRHGGVWLLKTVGVIQEHRVLLQLGHVGGQKNGTVTM
jgi:hypothetical protein